MQRTVIGMMIIGIIYLSFHVWGRYQSLQSKQLDVKDSGVVLLKPTKQWTDAYGDGYNSQLHFTIALLINVVNKQGEIIGKLTKDVNDLKFDMVLGK